MDINKIDLSVLSSRSLSKEQATKIADGIYDGGQQLRNKIAFVLHGRRALEGETLEKIDGERYQAYLSLDDISRLLCDLILVQRPLDEVAVDFSYLIKNLQVVMSVLRTFPVEEYTGPTKF